MQLNNNDVAVEVDNKQVSMLTARKMVLHSQSKLLLFETSRGQINGTMHLGEEP